MFGFYMAAREAFDLEMYEMNEFPVKLKIDDEAVKTILDDSASTNMTKYMATKFYWVQQMVKENLIAVEYVSTNSNCDVKEMMPSCLVKMSKLKVVKVQHQYGIDLVHEVFYFKSCHVRLICQHKA